MHCSNLCSWKGQNLPRPVPTDRSGLCPCAFWPSDGHDLPRTAHFSTILQTHIICFPKYSFPWSLWLISTRIWRLPSDFPFFFIETSSCRICAPPPHSSCLRRPRGWLWTRRLLHIRLRHLELREASRPSSTWTLREKEQQEPAAGSEGRTWDESVRVWALEPRSRALGAVAQVAAVEGQLWRWLSTQHHHPA